MTAIEQRTSHYSTRFVACADTRRQHTRVPWQDQHAWKPEDNLHQVSVWRRGMMVPACLQAVVRFEGCQAVLQKGLPEAEAATPSAEVQFKLQEVPSIARP